MVNAVGLHLVQDVERVAKRLRHIGKHLVHLLTRLEPLLLRVEHTRGVVKVLARGKTQQVVVGLGVILVHEVGVVRTHQLDAILLRQLNEHLVGLLLQRERLAVGTQRGVFHLMSLKLQIIVVAKHAAIPLNRLARTLNVTVENLLGHLTRDAGRAHNEILMIFLQVLTIRTRTHVIAVDPRTRHQFYKVLIAMIVFGEHNEVVATHVAMLLHLILLAVVSHIHLAAKYRFERLLTLFLEFAVHLIAIIEKLFYAEHVAMIGYGHAFHAVGNGLVDEFLHTRLSVQ